MKTFFITSILIALFALALDVYNSQDTTQAFFSNTPTNVNELVSADFSNLP